MFVLCQHFVVNLRYRRIKIFEPLGSFIVVLSLLLVIDVLLNVVVDLVTQCAKRLDEFFGVFEEDLEFDVHGADSTKHFDRCKREL